MYEVFSNSIVSRVLFFIIMIPGTVILAAWVVYFICEIPRFFKSVFKKIKYEPKGFLMEEMKKSLKDESKSRTQHYTAIFYSFLMMVRWVAFAVFIVMVF